jgi:Raf kinase inhibitor-like YbhB/YbcL family protein
VRSPALLLAVTVLLAACGGGERPGTPLPGAAATLRLASPAFRDGGSIPQRYTCDGDGVSPPLSWTGVPEQTCELALVVEDPDAGHFLHWTVLRIPVSRSRFAVGRAPRGTVEADNSFGDPGWGAPCPPKGDRPHRYTFALYALSASLDVDEHTSPDELRRRLAEKALARGVLTGRFGRG